MVEQAASQGRFFGEVQAGNVLLRLDQPQEVKHAAKPRPPETRPTRGKTRSNKFKRATESAIYVLIAEKIRVQLAEGQFGESARLPSIRELSTTFDVNYLTARQALKHLESLGLVFMETGRSTYVTTRRSQQMTVGVVVPDLSYKVNSGISRGIREETSRRDVTPVFMNFHNDVNLEVRFLERLRTEKFSGALVYPSLERDNPPATLENDPG